MSLNACCSRRCWDMSCEQVGWMRSFTDFSSQSPPHRDLQSSRHASLSPSPSPIEMTQQGPSPRATRGPKVSLTRSLNTRTFHSRCGSPCCCNLSLAEIMAIRCCCSCCQIEGTNFSPDLETHSRLAFVTRTTRPAERQRERVSNMCPQSCCSSRCRAAGIGSPNPTRCCTATQFVGSNVSS